MLEKNDLDFISKMIADTLEPVKDDVRQLEKELRQRDEWFREEDCTEADATRDISQRVQTYASRIRESAGKNKRKAKVLFSQAGGSAGKGSKTTKITLPITWVREMGITEEEREVDISFQDGKIIIEKSSK